MGFINNYTVGQTITGTLEKRVSFGLFVKLVPGVTGLLPQSKITQSPDRSTLEKLKEGDTIPVTIEEINYPKERSPFPLAIRRKKKTGRPMSNPKKTCLDRWGKSFNPCEKKRIKIPDLLLKLDFDPKTYQ